MLAEKDQVALAHLLALNGVSQKVVLLVRIAWQDIAAHAVAQLDEAAAIDALACRSAPQVGNAEKRARVLRHHSNWLARKGLGVEAHRDMPAVQPRAALAGQRHLQPFQVRYVKQWQHR